MEASDCVSSDTVAECRKCTFLDIFWSVDRKHKHGKSDQKAVQEKTSMMFTYKMQGNGRIKVDSI